MTGITEEALMRIGELAARAGVSVRALRYYAEQNLLASVRSPHRHHGGHHGLEHGPAMPSVSTAPA